MSTSSYITGMVYGFAQFVTSLVCADPGFDYSLHIAAQGYDDAQEVDRLLKAGYEIDSTEPNEYCTALHFAAEAGNLNTIRLLLQRGANIKAKTKNGITPLHLAARGRKMDCCELLMEKGADPNARTENGWTPLHDVCRTAFSVAVLSTMIEKGADTNAVSKDGTSALHLISRTDAGNDYRRHFCRILIANGSPVDNKDQAGQTPLHVAICNHQLDICKSLVNNGADTRARTNNGDTPLHLAVEHDQREIFELLLDNGADVNAQNGHKYTPLHLAAIKNNSILADSLLRTYNADPNLRDCHGFSCLHRAARQGSLDVVKSILILARTNSIDINSICEGLTALHCAILTCRVPLVELLLRFGAKYNGRARNTYYKMTPIEMSERFNSIDIREVLHLVEQMLEAAAINQPASVQSLIEEGALVNARDGKDGKSALHHAILNRNLPLTRYLLDQGARLEDKTCEGCTSLHLSLVSNEYRIAEVLIDRAVSKLPPLDSLRLLNAKTSREADTALHLATRLERLELVKLLVKSGAVYNAKNAEGYTPADLAVGDLKKYFTSIANLFEHTAAGNNQQVTDILAQEPTVINARDVNGGKTALYLALQGDHKAVANTLLRKGSNVWLVTENGDTVLHIASSNGHADIIDDVLAKWTDSERRILADYRTTAEKNSALHLAKNIEVARNLLKNGAYYNGKNSSGKTPAETADDAAVRSLLELTGRLWHRVKGGNLDARERAEVDVKDWPAITGSSQYQSRIKATADLVIQHLTPYGNDEGHYLISDRKGPAK